MILIGAVSKNWGIGFNGDLLFKIPEDLKFFRERTLNKYVIMGHGTFKSLPEMKPLPNRKNIILSRNKELKIDNSLVFTGKEELFDFLNKENIPKEELFICGGEQVYKEFLPYCHKAYITKIEEIKQADRFLPDMDRLKSWRVFEKSGEYCYNGLKYEFVTYINAEPVLYSTEGEMNNDKRL